MSIKDVENKNREEERIVAILKGDFLAKNFPKTWYGIQERKEVGEITERQKLEEFLNKKLRRN